MQTFENQWGDAIEKRDQFALENVLAPTFVDISAQGDVTTRNQQIARMYLKDNSGQKLEQKVVNVRMLGDIALVTGTYALRKRDSAGTLNEKGVFTHVYQRTTRAWWCVQSQRTAVVEQEVPRNKPKKQSSAEEPFHIPGIYKGAKPASPQGIQPTPAPQTPAEQAQPQ